MAVAIPYEGYINVRPVKPMEESINKTLPGFVRGIPYTTRQLDGSKAAKRVMASNFDPSVINIPGTLSAVPHDDGMILHFVSTGSEGKETRWPVSQTQADSIFVNQQGEFEISKV